MYIIALYANKFVVDKKKIKKNVTCTNVGQVTNNMTGTPISKKLNKKTKNIQN